MYVLCIVIHMHFIFVVGQNYIVAVTGFYCKLCSKFYNNEKAAKESHCQSRSHYDKYKVPYFWWCGALDNYYVELFWNVCLKMYKVEQFHARCHFSYIKIIVHFMKDLPT